MATSNSAKFKHGKVRFQDFNYAAPFMILPSHAEIDNIFKEILTHWKLNVPRVCLFLISDPDISYSWKDIDLKSFATRFLNSVNLGEIWIFTNGLNSGILIEIARLIWKKIFEVKERECLFKCSKDISFRVALIGTCSYYSVSYVEELIPYPLPITLQNGRFNTNEKYDLNPHHTHFIIIKDKNPFSVHDFILKLANEISVNVKHTSLTHSLPLDPTRIEISRISVVTMLLQGKLSTLDHIQKHLEQKHALIVVKGSGGLADIFAYVFYKIQNIPNDINFANYTEEVLKHIVCMKVKSKFPNSKLSLFQHGMIFDKLLQCIISSRRESGSLIGIIDATKKSELNKFPRYIFEAFLKSKIFAPTYNKLEYIREDLNLAIEWNYVHISLKNIISNYEADLNSIVGGNILTKVLLKPDREKFLEMFLKNGYQLHQIITAHFLLILFNEIKDEKFFVEVIMKTIVGKVYSDVITTQCLNEILCYCIESLTGLTSFINLEDLNSDNQDKYFGISKEESEERARILLTVWASLSFRLNLLNAIVQTSRQPVTLSIFLSCLLNNLSKHVFDITKKRELAKHHITFSKRAIDLLDIYSKDVPNLSFKFIQHMPSIWCYKSVIDLASFAKNENFLAHPCCQTYLEHTFMGNIRIQPKLSGIKLILSAFLLFPMHFWISFYSNADQLASSNIDLFSHDKSKPNYFTCDTTRIGCKQTRFIKNEATDLFGSAVPMKKINPPFAKKVYYLWTSPITKFYAYHFIYAIYIIFFSASILWPSCGNAVLDLFICIWTLFLLLDTMCNVYNLRKEYTCKSIKWDILQCILFILFLGVSVLNTVLNIRFFPSFVKYVMAVLLLYLFYRFSWTMLFHSTTMGPFMYRVRTMIRIDFVNCMIIGAYFLISNDIALSALIYPDEYESETIFRRSLDRLVQSLFLSPNIIDYGVKPESCIIFKETFNKSDCRAGFYISNKCKHQGIVPNFIFMQHTIFFSLILLISLRAMFTMTAQKTHMTIHWKFDKYNLLTECQKKILPFPLSFIDYSIKLFSYLFVCCKLQKKQLRSHSRPYDTLISKFSTFTYPDDDYFDKLNQNYYKKLYFNKTREQHELIRNYGNISEKMKSKSANVAKYQSNIVHLCNEMERKRYETKNIPIEPSELYTHHVLSRQSPYPFTRIYRFPVPDSYVQWNIKWNIYDPRIFTLPKEKYEISFQKYVDNDMYLRFKMDFREIYHPVYMWNQSTLSQNGLFTDRQSWITDNSGNPLLYKTNSENLPLNPIGRTGLRGKGSLPRWGPNHYVFIFISMYVRCESLLNTNSQIRFLIKSKMNKYEKCKISLPGGFVTSDEKYLAVREFFDPNGKEWKTLEDMILYFALHSMERNFDFDLFSFNIQELGKNQGKLAAIDYRLVKKGYMDSSFNTDEAWKEIEFWHIHFNEMLQSEPKLGLNLKWIPFNSLLFFEEMNQELTSLIKKTLSLMDIEY